MKDFFYLVSIFYLASISLLKKPLCSIKLWYSKEKLDSYQIEWMEGLIFEVNSESFHSNSWPECTRVLWCPPGLKKDGNDHFSKDCITERSHSLVVRDGKGPRCDVSEQTERRNWSQVHSVTCWPAGNMLTQPTIERLCIAFTANVSKFPLH